MRRTITSFFLLLVSLAVCYPGIAQDNQAMQGVRFDKKTHDFGVFTKKNSLHKCKFEIENTGKTALVIQRIVTNCGCAVASYTYTPLKPGSKGEIEVKYDGKGKAPGVFIKSVLVYTNLSPQPFKLYIKGVMK